jgi:hypothetical protein
MDVEALPAVMAHLTALGCLSFAVAALWTGRGTRAFVPLIYLTVYAEYYATGMFSVWFTVFVFGWFKDEIMGMLAAGDR